MKLKRLELTLSIGCKLNCLYCPQKLLLSKYGNSKRYLKFDDFKKVVSKVATGGWLIFNGMSEPFLNRECLKMLQYASDNGYNISMATTLVGLREDELEQLGGVHFKGFVLHIPDKENNSKFVITEEYMSVLRWVCEHIQITGISCHGEVHPVVKDLISETIPFFNQMGDRAGNLPFVEGHDKRQGRIVCAQGHWRTGYLPEMLPDGRVVLCCQDYGMQHVLGNLIEQEWDEIVHGREFRNILCGWETDNSEILCRKCGGILDWQDVNCFNNANMLWPITMRQGMKIESARHFGESDNEILYKVATAKAICIWGLGAFFKEDFFLNGWNEILKPKYYTDMNITQEMKEYFGEQCIEIEEVVRMKNLLVVIYVKNTDSIEKILQENTIDYIKIQDLYEKI